MDPETVSYLTTMLNELRDANEELRLDLRRIVDAQHKQSGMIAGLGPPLQQLASVMTKLAADVDELEVKVGSLTATVDELTARMDLITDVQRQTDSRLDVVIATVDDLIRRLG